MPRKVEPASEFGKKLYRLRQQRGLTQVKLAQAIGSTQRAISFYETVAEYPPAAVLIKLADALGVSTDELLGRKPITTTVDNDPAVMRVWRKFQQVLKLPDKDQRAILRMINSISAAQR